MDWYLITQALLLGAILIYIYPRMKQASKDSPKPTASDWQSLLPPVLIVGAIVAFLIASV